MNKLSSYAALASGLALLSTAHADDSFRFGGSRSAGMGGAGLALPIDIIQNHRLNPAMLGFGRRKIGLQYPEFGIQTKGIGISDFRDAFGDLNNGGVDSDKVVNLARKYGDRRVDAAADGSIGFVAGGFAISGGGAGAVASIPNASLSTFVASGNTDYSQLPADARLDAYGYAYYEVDASYGAPVRTGAGTLAIGGRLRDIKAYYGHKVADQGSIQSGAGVQNGAEFGGSNDDTMDKNSLGFDLGVLYQPKVLSNLYVGATVENLVVPKVGFTRTLPNSDVLTEDFNPFKTTTSVGVGAIVGKTLLLAADIHDVFNRAGDEEVRLGGELNVGRLVSVRAGYNSRTAFTVGLSVGGFNFSLAGNQAVTFSSNIKF